MKLVWIDGKFSTHPWKKKKKINILSSTFDLEKHVLFLSWRKFNLKWSMNFLIFSISSLNILMEFMSDSWLRYLMLWDQHTTGINHILWHHFVRHPVKGTVGWWGAAAFCSQAAQENDLLYCVVTHWCSVEMIYIVWYWFNTLSGSSLVCYIGGNTSSSLLDH